MENQSSITALISLFGRAYHRENDQPVLFDDPLSRQLMTEEEYRQIQQYMLSGIDFFAPDKKDTFSSEKEMLQWIVQTQISPTPLARARYCEDALDTAVFTGSRQYVILGAGMDTFAFRNPYGIPVFEVDHPMTQEEKRKRTARAGWKTPETLHFVPVDFTKDRLSEYRLSKKLTENGYNPGKKAFFSWLGVSYYLTMDHIDDLLEEIASVAAEGTSLVFDYASEELFTSPVKRVRNMLAMAAAGGEPMKTGFRYEQLESLLEKHGFLIYEHLETEEIQERFFAERTDSLAAFEHIRYVHAVRKI